MSIQRDVQEIIQALKASGYTAVGEPTEFGMEFTAKSGTHTVELTQDGITFVGTNDTSIVYAYGLGRQVPDIKAFIRKPKSFTELELDTVQSQPTTKPPKAAKAPKSTPNSAPRELSVRSLILQMLDAHKGQPQEATQLLIIDALAKNFPDQDQKKLKSRIYLHRSEWNKMQNSPAEAPKA